MASCEAVLLLTKALPFFSEQHMIREHPVDAAGAAIGTGSALAHRAVDSVLGSRHPEPAQAQQAAEQLAREPDVPCSRQAKTFADCMADNNGEMGSCQYYFDTLRRCRGDAVQQEGSESFQ